MKILVIEDDDLKFALLAGFLKDMLGAQVIRAASYQAGLEKLVNEAFDWVLLDMTLPVSDLAQSPVDMEWLPFGGEYILRECSRRRIKPRVIVVSQYNTFVRENEEVSFEQLKEEILNLYGAIVIGCVQLNRASDNWKTQILDYIKNANSNS